MTKQMVIAGVLVVAILSATVMLSVGLRDSPTRLAIRQESSAAGPATVASPSVVPTGRSAETSKRDGPWAWFVDVTQKSGIVFRRFNGYTGNYWPCEVTGGGVGMADFNGDGWLDLYLVNGSKLPADPSDRSYSNVLFRCRGDGTFEDITTAAQVGHPGYGQGCAVADYDNDGFSDLYVTNFGENVLYYNQGDGTFARRSEAGVGRHEWSSSAAFGDLDRDGDVDLYVCNYVQFDPVNSKPCASPVTQKRGYCGPEHYQGTPNWLYENLGNGQFRDVSREAGVVRPDSKGLGVVIARLDDDEWPDIFVANDLVPNFLFENHSARSAPITLVEVAMERGCAVNGEGQPEAGMGIACGDYDGDGRLDLICTHFYMEHDTLFRNLGAIGFIDATAEAGLSAATRASMGWGTAFLDYDKDGWLDWVVTNGHLNNQEEASIPYRMESKLFHNSPGQRRFEDVSDMSGEFFRRKAVGRGLAVGDMDRDGDEDLAITFLHEPFVPVLLALGSLLTKQGRYDEAEQLLERLRELEPKHPAIPQIERELSQLRTRFSR